MIYSRIYENLAINNFETLHSNITDVKDLVSGVSHVLIFFDHPSTDSVSFPALIYPPNQEQCPAIFSEAGVVLIHLALESAPSSKHHTITQHLDMIYLADFSWQNNDEP